METIVKTFKPCCTKYKIVRFVGSYPYVKINDFIKKHQLEEAKYKIITDCLDIYNKSCDVAIMFSGGYDSLALTLNHLEKGESVGLLSLAFNSQEQMAAEITFSILQDMYGSSKVSFQKILGPITLNGTESTYGLSQQPFAAFVATFMSESIRNSAKTLEIAYCSNDDALSYLPELKTLYDTAFAFKYGVKKYPEIQFPSIKKKHYENIDYVTSIERKYGVLFPTFSSEHCNTTIYEKKQTRIITICCNENTEKENKKCDVCGYVVIKTI